MYHKKLPSYAIPSDLINHLARSYSTLDYAHKLKILISTVLPDLNIHSLSKRELHLIINNILVKNYLGEEIIKYKLLKSHINKKNTLAFEIRVIDSRVDFLTVNGFTTSYEIKSKLDNLNKLAKQVKDYERVFEFNYLVIDEKHLNSVLNQVPENFGIYLFQKNKEVLIKEAKKNEQLDPKLQLQLFTKKDLKFFFDKLESITQILLSYSAEEINFTFKLMLKRKYERKSEFIKANQTNINPIDFHFFFHNNIPPELVYGTK